MKLTLKDYIKNLALNLKSIYRYFQKITTNGGEFSVPDGYKLIFLDTFSCPWQTNWNLSFTEPQPYHPGATHQWFSEDQILQGQKGLKLYSRFDPRYFPEISTVIPDAIGGLTSKRSFKHGIFRFDVSFPEGQWLWAAIWLSGATKWPPEIDIAECWTKEEYYCSKPTTNIHFGRNGEHKQYISYAHLIPKTDHIECVLHWEADFIKVYYNGYLVYHITDNRSLNDMFDEMKIIFTAGVSDSGNFTKMRSPLIIHKVEVFQKPD